MTSGIGQSNIMDCCSSINANEKNTPQACRNCGEAGRPVDRQTVVHHVKSERLALAGPDEYRFCSAAHCPVVYYTPSGNVFRVDDLREAVSSKTEGDSRPLCYCFGFTEGFVRREIAQTGETSVPGQVSRLVGEKLCRCEIRNPSGVCCLGEINKTSRRLLAQAVGNQSEAG